MAKGFKCDYYMQIFMMHGLGTCLDWRTSVWTHAMNVSVDDKDKLFWGVISHGIIDRRDFGKFYRSEVEFRLFLQSPNSWSGTIRMEGHTFLFWKWLGLRISHTWDKGRNQMEQFKTSILYEKIEFIKTLKTKSADDWNGYKTHFQHHEFF